jgi:hypothetical protein
MAATTVAITSYSPEIGRVGRKPQFNGLPASIYQNGTVPPDAMYVTGGTITHETPVAATPVPAPAVEPAIAG